jgi:hypothetical protein
MPLDPLPQDSRSNHPSERKGIRGDAWARCGNVGGRIETKCASRFAVDDVCLQHPPKTLSILLIMLC